MCKHNIEFLNCDECNKDIKIFFKLTTDFGVNTANEWAESEQNASLYWNSKTIKQKK